MSTKKFKFNPKFITNNFWLKLISFIAAVMVWIYVSSELLKGIRT